MKRLVLIFLLCFCFVQAQAKTVTVVVGQGTAAAPAVSYVLLWNGDDCTGNDRRDAKLSSDSCDITGTLAAGAEIITTDESSYYFKSTAANEYLRFASSSVTGYDPDEIYIKMIVKLETNTAGANSIFENITDANNRMFVTVNGSNGQVTLSHSGNGTDSYNVGNDNSVEALQYGYWGVVELKFSVTNSVISLRVCSTVGADCTECSGSEPWDTTTDTGHEGFADMTATPTNITIGEDQQGSFTNNLRVTYFEVRTYANAP